MKFVTWMSYMHDFCTCRNLLTWSNSDLFELQKINNLTPCWSVSCITPLGFLPNEKQDIHHLIIHTFTSPEYPSLYLCLIPCLLSGQWIMLMTAEAETSAAGRNHEGVVYTAHAGMSRGNSSTFHGKMTLDGCVKDDLCCWDALWQEGMSLHQHHSSCQPKINSPPNEDLMDVKRMDAF